MIWLALAATLSIASTACAGLNGLTEIPSTRTSARTVTGEIRSVDSRRDRIRLRDDRGTSHDLRVDQRTRVVHGQRQYPVSALEQGDRVQVRFARDHAGNLIADRIDVVRNVRDRRAATARVQRIEGGVGRVDTRRRYFTVERNRSGATIVHVPDRLGREADRRFARLRRGDRVRIEVRTLDSNVAELVRFR